MSASGGGDQSWQSILDLLTVKAKKDGLMMSIKNAKGFEAKINKVRDSIVIRNKLATWISVCAESHYSKSGGIATRLRDEGNLKFRNHDNQGALRLYAESVICAPEYGPELSLAYGNRSAALYHLAHYSDCLQDVDLALKYRYPKNLEYKLHQRKGQCLNKIGKHSEAIRSFEAAIDSLKYIQKLTETKRFSLVKDLQALIKETKAMMTGDDDEESSVEVDPVIPPEVPSLGLHPSISGGSSCLELKKDPVKGRYIVTNEDVKLGDVLFSESPYSSVLLPEHYASHCHHCYKALLVAVPCLKCTQPRYCSEACRIKSWSQYHQFECGNLDLLHSVGIAHLAQRTVLLCGFEKLCSLRPEMNKHDSLSTNAVVGNEVDRYPDVFNLLSHVDDLEPEDLFQYAVTATLLTTSLERRTKFFSVKNGVDSMVSNLSLNRNSLDSDQIDEDNVVFVGGIILRHITQLVCNASAIYEVGQSPSSSSMDDMDGSAVVDNNQYRIAVALYPGASLMNHSCDPSVINSFYGSRIIVRAIKDLKSGLEVFNCYGPHFRRHPLETRKEMLRSQYHFNCDCVPCTEKEFQEFEERFSALKCHFCDGPIKNPSSENSLEHSLPCYDCGKEQSYSDRIEAVFVAYDLFKKGMECLKVGNMSEAVPALQSCYQIRLKAMYPNHREVTEVADQLARCFCLMGQFREAAQYLKACLPAVEERFGSHSIEVGHELVKYTDVLLNELQDSGHRKISHFEEKTVECRTCLERASNIFELHYGKWNSTYKEIIHKLNTSTILRSN